MASYFLALRTPEKDVTTLFKQPGRVHVRQLLFCHQFYEEMTPRPEIQSDTKSVESTRPQYKNK